MVRVEDELSSAPRSPPMTGPRSDRFEEFFAAHWGGAYRLAGLMGAEDPENVAQEALARLHTKFARLDDGVQAQRYLRATVCNLSRSTWRRRRVAERALPRLVTASPLDPMAGIGEAEAVLTALRELSSRQRQVIVLRFWMELSQAEISETLSISPGSVKTHTFRGMQALRNRLEP